MNQQPTPATLSHQISLTVIDDSDFLSKYCGKEPIISQEVADYIENLLQAVHLRKRSPLTIQIGSKVISEQESIDYAKAIRNYYKNSMLQTKRDLLRNTMISLIMLLFGIGFFALMVVLTIWNTNTILNEILNIVAWVFVWEAVDQFVFERHRLRKVCTKQMAIVNATISFSS